MIEPKAIHLPEKVIPTKITITESETTSKDRRFSRSMEHVRPLRILLDVFVFLCAFLPVVIFAMVVQPYERGFYCDDDTIRYPYKDSTVANITLYVFGLAIPLLTIMIIEAYRTYVFEPKRLNCAQQPHIYVRGKPCGVYSTRIYYYAGYFLFGAALCQTLTDIAKYTIGRLRPHFISVCDPDWSQFACDNHAYIEKPLCRGSQWLIREARLSFPSGHSSFGFYSMMYCVYYVHAQLGWPIMSRLVKHVLQFIYICLALGTALSRISDYKHHWSDVFAGCILGIVVSTIVARYLARLFTYPKHSVFYHGMEASNVEALQKLATENGRSHSVDSV